ncbi:type II toxin-antitoxin system VapC family toxin [Streptomyces qinzhouensis]|uniref:Ribonuclease VapC n=1 Tax=Streptomyces qinzhouensis TaxID=2599401 RepID=A0A5B8IJ63_9ACTN|nr:type II toxin-antitoxin system VapC family toxin [Streptomyces qinzhouensis]QDY77409.1 type II toxin-antitoxin system VapC family toxin [Streptomyces qinzhouensis]
MSVLVLDTSALVAFLVGQDDLADEVRRTAEGHRLAAPHAVDLECASVLRGLTRGKKLSDTQAEQALKVLSRMALRRYDHTPLLPRIWQLRHNMWPYDASFIALAEQIGADLVTADAKLAGAPGLRCTIRNLRA